MRQRTLAVLLAVLLVCACGQKGPLFRPGKQTAPAPPSSLASVR